MLKFQVFSWWNQALSIKVLGFLLCLLATGFMVSAEEISNEAEPTEDHPAELSILKNPKQSVERRIEALSALSLSESKVTKQVMYKILKNEKEKLKLRDRIADFLVNRPSVPNLSAVVNALATTHEPSLREELTKSLKRINPSGPIIGSKDHFNVLESKLSAWKLWFKKYAQEMK